MRKLERRPETDAGGYHRPAAAESRPMQTGPSKKTEKKPEAKTASKQVELTETQKASLVATVMAESKQGEWEYREIAWVYLNLIQSEGFDTGMSRSSAYSQKNIWYKVYMVYLGQGKEYKDDTSPYLTVMRGGKETKAKNISDYIANNGYFKDTIIPRITKMKDYIQKDVLKKQDKNPLPNFKGQGYWMDLNNYKQKGDHWHVVRQYYLLTLKKKAQGIYIKKIGSGDGTSFLFNLDGIQFFFKEHPTLLPADRSQIPDIYHGEQMDAATQKATREKYKPYK